MANLCSVHCKTCDEKHKERCQSCQEGYKLHGYRCIHKKILAMLLFDNDTHSVMLDSAALLDGKTQLDVLRNQSAAYQVGVFGQAARLGANFRLDMKPLDHGLENWAIKVYLKPITTPRVDEKFDLLTVNELNDTQLKIQIQLANGTSGSLLNVVVNFLGEVLIISSPLQWGTKVSTFDTTQFHLLEIKFKDGVLTTIYDDYRNDVLLNTWNTTRTSFRRWWLGSDHNGAKLYLDTFQLIDLDRMRHRGSPPTPGSTQTAGNNMKAKGRTHSMALHYLTVALALCTCLCLVGCYCIVTQQKDAQGNPEEYYPLRDQDVSLAAL